MSSISFIDFIFPQFMPENWRSGISIYRAGGVGNFQRYGELVSARVKAGIGENYDVRMKLHAGGKCVQYMECTCQAYRRRNERCGHMAALCIFLDQEKPEILVKMNMGAGHSERYMNTESDSAQKFFAPEAAAKASKTTVLEAPATEAPAKDWLAEIKRPKNGRVVSLSIDEDPPTLLVTTLIEETRKLTYRLGVDDALRILAEPEFFALLPKKVQTIQSQNFAAKRFFDLSRHDKDGLRITRMISIADKNGKEKKLLSVAEIRPSSCGKVGVYSSGLGFVPFVDDMNPTRIARWEEYPKTAIIDGETAANLFQTQFSRLKETAELRLSADLAKMSVVEKLEIPELKLKASTDGYFIVDASIKGVLPLLPRAQGPGATKSPTQSTLIAILKARAEGKQYLSTKTGWIKLGDDYDWLQGKVSSDGKLKLSALELIKFREQFAAEAEISGQGEIIQRIRSGLVSSKELELPALSSTRLTLRPYQEEGVKWLWWLYKNRLGGLLADEMGLGKTHQAMALLAAVSRTEVGHLSLVVCPTTVIDHWIDKMKKFVPGTNFVLYHGPNRRLDEYRHPREHRVIITSYGILLRDIEFLVQCPWAVVILDEAHMVKNQSTRTYRAACKLPSKMRLCLTGTPLENDLFELKNLFDYIVPSYLGTDSEFKKKYMATGANEMNPMSELELRRLIHPFKMRRNKRDVLSELPEKVEDIRHCHLNKDQHRLYVEALSLKGAALVDALQTNQGPIPYIHIFSVISLLKQICDDPGLIDPRYENIGSGKLDLFDELLREAFESDQKVVVFSQYAKMVARLSQRLTRQGINHVSLTGSTMNRGEVVRQFQENPEVKVFLGSLLAGGTGIDLTSGNVVIHFDRWWNAAKENQATDRIHRIGQTRNVQVYKLVTKGTLEEKIDEIINRKRILFERFVEQDNEIFKNLSREDLLNLLSPPEAESVLDIEERDEAPRSDVSPTGSVEI